jgi:uncharacterized glyoxalase superfamily protein PhnB
MDEHQRIENQALNGAAFVNCSMKRASFDDVNLSDSVFTNISFHRARLTDINFSGTTIEDANLSGMTILGHDVEVLIRHYQSASASETLVANDAVRMFAEPQIFVADVGAACQFYVEKMGFNVAFSYGQPAFYAQIIRDGCRLNLRRVSVPVFDASFREREADALSATLTLDDARPLFLEFLNAGVDFHQPLKVEPWNALTFIVRDIDDNLIAFAGRSGVGEA